MARLGSIAGFSRTRHGVVASPKKSNGSLELIARTFRTMAGLVVRDNAVATAPKACDSQGQLQIAILPFNFFLFLLSFRFLSSPIQFFFHSFYNTSFNYNTYIFFTTTQHKKLEYYKLENLHILGLPTNNGATYNFSRNASY